MDPFLCAWMASAPEDWPWSSYRAHAQGHDDPLLTPHPCYLTLGTDAASRAAAWRALFDEAMAPKELAAIRAHLQQQKVFGSDRFQAWVEERTGRFQGIRPRGRPRKKQEKCP